jgi:DNA-binding response OmpR family regulator
MYQQTGGRAKRVIIVDRDTPTAELIAEFLRDEGLVPLCYANWLLSVSSIEQAQANLLILELGLGDPSASLDLLGALRRNPPTSAMPVIVNSTDDRMLARLAAPLRDLGCVVLTKPFELDDLSWSIRACLDLSPSKAQRLIC